MEKDGGKGEKLNILPRIAVFAVIAVIFSAIIIANIFIPVKYLSAYTVIFKDGRPQDCARATFINVGLGDCSLVELPDGKILLTDGGDGSYGNELTVLSVLNSRGVTAIDYLICTSVNVEHCGGLSEILKYKRVNNIYLPDCRSEDGSAFEDFYLAAMASGAEIFYGGGEKGAEWEFEIINFASASGFSFANLSNAVKLSCFGTKFLIAGDASVSQLTERARKGEIGLCDVVTVSAHGNNYETCAPLYDILRPEAVVISTVNPQAAAIADARAHADANLYRTDVNGHITFTVNNATYSVHKEKK